MRLAFRLVLDTNILVRGLLNERCASGMLLDLCQRRAVVPVLSLPVLAEYRSILSGPELVNCYPQLTADRVRVALERIVYVSDLIRPVRARFELPRDPKDAKLVELAIAARATHLISTDRDLLDLSTGSDETSRRFRRRLPGITLLKPNIFMDLYGSSL